MEFGCLVWLDKCFQSQEGSASYALFLFLLHLHTNMCLACRRLWQYAIKAVMLGLPSRGTWRGVRHLRDFQEKRRRYIALYQHHMDAMRQPASVRVVGVMGIRLSGDWGACLQRQLVVALAQDSHTGV
jgi:hypothetical protein